MANHVPAASRLVTADELLRMPDDGLRRELVHGNVKVTPPAGEEHGVLAAEIIIRLGSHVRSRGLGRVYAAETGFRIGSNPDTVLAPDAAFVRQERIDRVGVGKGYRLGAPDLVVEVMSPSDSQPGMDAKVNSWLSAGCRMAVVVNPARRGAIVYRPDSEILLLSENDVLDGGDVVPGWRLPLRELFG